MCMIFAKIFFSLALNAMIYNRGTIGSYKKWVDIAGDESQKFDDLLPYFATVLCERDHLLVYKHSDTGSECKRTFARESFRIQRQWTAARQSSELGSDVR
jgi:hypothetical protein